MDGIADSTAHEGSSRRRRLPGDICAVFVHAGAGYHSVQNERVHLVACEDAARSAMTFLNNGGSAVDAVEIAIKVLEDKEITNAGFGSNLAIDGSVECDATIVDHYGRSGAVGAVGCIRNPIHLARLILEYSSQPLSLRRVPPNLLVGPGATDFAAEIGVPVVHPDLLVSPSAGERYQRWKRDLNKTESTDDNDDTTNLDDSTPKGLKGGRSERIDRNLDLAPCWNESQPYSPRDNVYESKNPLDVASENRRSSPMTLQRSHDGPTSNPSNQGTIQNTFSDSTLHDSNPVPQKRVQAESPRRKRKAEPDQHDADHSRSKFPKAPPPTRSESPEQGNIPQLNGDAVIEQITKPDNITDTVGAIAIDCFGNVAAGSSSGGIGMKHRGRLGPAALVGIGTAVIPLEPKDETKLSVATVTSGTGEHMATTMAAGSCARRLYSTNRKGKSGLSEPAADDDQAMRSFVEKDFMGHPSVKHSHSAGAIGILGVKKTTGGVQLYFAHNTDSFAICSMTSDDKEPKSVMSRSKGHGAVITGGRMIKHRRWPSSHKDTWPVNPDSELEPQVDGPQTSKRQKSKRVPKSKSPKVNDTNGGQVVEGKGDKRGSSRSSERKDETSNSVF